MHSCTTEDEPFQVLSKSHQQPASTNSHVLSKVSLVPSQGIPLHARREHPLSGAKSTGPMVDFKRLVKVPLYRLTDAEIRLLESAINSIDADVPLSRKP